MAKVIKYDPACLCCKTLLSILNTKSSLFHLHIFLYPAIIPVNGRIVQYAGKIFLEIPV